MTNTAEHTALFIGPANAEFLTGFPWRRVKELAVRLGVERKQAGKARLIPVRAFLDALDAANAPASTPADEAERVREALRRRRVTG